MKSFCFTLGSGLTNSEDIQFDVMKTDEECICLELKGLHKIIGW